jgi:phage tail sheath gpL-like
MANDQIPGNLRTPFVSVAFDASQARQGASLLNYRALLLGQMTDDGSATADEQVLITSAVQAEALFGAGSQLALMATSWFKANTFTELYAIPLADAGAAVAAGGSIALSGAPTQAGTIALYIGGQRVPVVAASGATAATLATAVAAAITAASSLPVSAEVNGDTDTQVDLTAKNAGTAGNDIDVRVNYNTGEALPAGLTVTITPMANGATDPSLADAITAMGDDWFNIIAHPWANATVLAELETELADRAGPLRQIDGVAFTAAIGSPGTLTTLGGGRNSQFSTIVAATGIPNTPFEVAASVAGIVALAGQADPARPFQTLALPGILAPWAADRFTQAERNTLLFNGIATVKTAAGGVVQIERLVTTYQENAAGASDDAYLDVETVLTLMYLRYDFRNRIQTKYPRHKLGDDGVLYGEGQPVMTPSIGRAEAIAWFRDMEQLALVEDIEQFKADLVVTRDAVDRNRLNWTLPPDLINQLRVSAAVVQFRL